MQMIRSRALSIVWTATLGVATIAHAQAPAVPRASGAVKATSAQSLSLTTAAGKDVAVTIPDGVKVMQVAPGSTDLKSATPSAISDITVGDKVIVIGTAGDSPEALHATRVIVMKSADIAQTHAAEEAAWTHGSGGLVQSVDTATGAIVIVSGTHTVTVSTTPTTAYHRYSGDSVKFEDAVTSKFADIRAGDQLRVRGTRSEDGNAVKADAIVTGSFRNFSGLIASIDAAAGTVTLKDLASKKTVTVKVLANSDLRRIPAAMAARFAARSTGAPGATPAAGGPPAGGGARTPGAGGPPAGGPGGPGGPGGARAAGTDLSQMLSRLPTESLGGLKVGDAVMIVATQPPSETAQPTAVTLLAGVEPILQASPKGEMVLSPWSVGGGAPEGGGGGQ